MPMVVVRVHATEAEALRRAANVPRTLPRRSVQRGVDLLELQRTVGNRAVVERLLQPQRPCVQQLPPPSRPSAAGRPTDHLRQEDSSTRIVGPKASPSRSCHLGTISVTSPGRRSRLNKFSAQIQPKLVIGRASDPLEHEADLVADQIMRIPNSAVMGDLGSTSERPAQFACAERERSRGGEDAVRTQVAEPGLLDWQSPLPTALRESNLLAGPTNLALQRAAEREETLERLIQSYFQDTETLQRQARSGEDTDETAAAEQILMQAKPADAQPETSTYGLEPAVRSLEGNGQPLPAAIRQYMEPRFGRDFSSMRIHIDGRAAGMARLANACAFTTGRNVVFASGEYAPSGSTDSLRLLAHELTHVIQQGQADPGIQRKIAVSGKPYAPSTRYLAWLTANFGPAMREFVEHMHNGGNPPDYTFSSFNEMGFEVRTRAAAIKGIEDVHKGCCDYFSNLNPPHLDSTYWQRIGGGVHFRLKSPLPVGKKPSDAIEAIFAPGAGTRLECLSMTSAIEYRSLLKSIGAASFDAKFPGGAGIDISASAPFPLFVGPSKKFEIKAVASKSDILPGDWVYFKNFHDYTARVPGGYWQGENAIALGGGKFRGFGVSALSETDMNQELVNQYNTGAMPHMSKTVADLIADGGGLLLDPVIRPIISKIVP